MARAGGWERAVLHGHVPEHPAPQAAGTEYFSLDVEDVPAAGSRPDRLFAVTGPQARVQRRTVQQIVDFARNNEWEYKVRFVGREYRWQEFREDMCAPGASYCTGRIVDILSLKRRVPTFTLDCTDAYHQAPELDDVAVEPPEEYLNRLRAAGMCTNIWWKLQKQLPGRRQAGQRWVDHFTSAWTSWVSRGV